MNSSRFAVKKNITVSKKLAKSGYSAKSLLRAIEDNVPPTLKYLNEGRSEIVANFPNPAFRNGMQIALKKKGIDCEKTKSNQLILKLNNQLARGSKS